MLAKLPFSNARFGHDLIFATLSREKQLGRNILTNRGDKRQQTKGQGCQDVAWTQLRAKIPLRSSRGRDQIPYPSPDFELPRTRPESP